MRAWALPTSFRPPATTSPGAGAAKQGPAPGPWLAPAALTSAGAPSERRAAARASLRRRYALRGPPQARAGTTTQYVSSRSCTTARPPVGRRTQWVPASLSAARS